VTQAGVGEAVAGPDAGPAGAGPAGAAPWTLVDLIDVETLQSIQDTFARAFRLPTVIVDPEGRSITEITHRVRFCEDLTRTSATARPRCVGCDRRAMDQAAEHGRPSTFRCWNGLYDSAVPIRVKGRVLGFFLCGEVLASAPDVERYRDVALEIQVDPDEYVQALGQVGIVSLEQYEASVESMHVLADLIAQQAAAAIDNLRTLNEARRAKADAAQLLGELDTMFEGLRDVASQADFPATLQAVADNLAQLIPWDSCVIYLVDPDSDLLEPVVVHDAYEEAMARHRPRRGEGIVGKVAAGGEARRITNLGRDPDFVPTPGVPVEPETALVVPTIHDDVVSGVIMLSRFGSSPFTTHELQLLTVFAGQAAVSMEVSRLASQRAQRLREERGLGRLLAAMAMRTQPDAVCAEIVKIGTEVVEAEAGVVLAGSGVAARIVAQVGVSPAAADALVADLPTRLGEDHGGEPSVLELEDHSLLLVPLGTEGDPFLAIFLRRHAARWDLRLATLLGAQASLGLDRARMQARERRMLLEYRRLAEVGTELVTALNADEARERLIVRTPAIVGGDVSFIARLGAGPDAVPVEIREDRLIQRHTIRLEGPGRVAALRLRDNPHDRALFDSWCQAVFDALRPFSAARTFIAEPLAFGSEALGGLFVAWTGEGVDVAPEHRHLLSVVATAGGASLARFDAYIATDSSLRERVLELEALSQLAQRVGRLTHETPIVDELLSALQRVGGVEGAAYAVLEEGGASIQRASGIADEDLARLTAMLAGPNRWADSASAELDGERAVVSVPMLAPGPRDAALLVVHRGGDDGQRERVVSALARFGSMALENADLHDRQRQAIARLERANIERAEEYERLQQILSVHEALSLAVLEGQGLSCVVSSLQPFVAGDLFVVDAHDRVLASSSDDDELGWRPQPTHSGLTGCLVVEEQGWHMAAAPAAIQGEVLAWVVARLSAPPGNVERAAIEYCALVTALELLRDRTELEVETRLRGGFLEDLFREDHIPELITKQALVFGFDIHRPSRVLVVEGSPPVAAGQTADRPDVVDAETLYAAVTVTLRRWESEALVAIRGNAVVGVVHDDEPAADGPDHEALEDRLLNALRTRLPGLPVSIGVGTPCNDLADYRRSYVAARRGLDLLRLLGRRDRVFSFRSNTVETMLLRSSEPAIVLDFISRFVDPLDAYDAGHASRLRLTLEVYFRHAGNLEATARDLHIHVSTLRYRLKKVSELLDVNLKDSQAALDLHVALRAAKVLAVHRD